MIAKSCSVRKLTLAEAGSVTNSLGRLLRCAGLARAVADAIGPVGLATEAGSVTGSATKLGVGDEVHVVDAQLLHEVSIVCDNSSNAARLQQERTAQEPRFWAWAEAAPAMAARRIMDCFILMVVLWREQRLLADVGVGAVREK